MERKEIAQLQALEILKKLRDQVNNFLDEESSRRTRELIEKKMEELERGNFQYFRLLPGDEARANKTTLINDPVHTAVSYFHDNEYVISSRRPYPILRGAWSPSSILESSSVLTYETGSLTT